MAGNPTPVKDTTFDISSLTRDTTFDVSSLEKMNEDEQQIQATPKDIFYAPSALFEKGLKQIGSNPVAAAINMANGFAQFLPSMISALSKQGESVPVVGGPIKSLNDLAGKVFGGASDLENMGEHTVDSFMNYIGLGNEEQRNDMVALFAKTSPDKIMEIADALHGLNQFGAQAVAGSAVGKVASTMGKGAVEAYNKAGQPKIDPITQTPIKGSEGTEGRQIGAAVKGAVTAIPRNVIGSVARQLNAWETARRFASSAYKQPFFRSKGISQFSNVTENIMNEGAPAPTRSNLSDVTDKIAKISDAYQRAASSSAQHGEYVDYNRVLKDMRILQKQMEGHPKYKEVAEAFNDIRERMIGRLKQYPNGKVPIDAASIDKSAYQDLVGEAYGKNANTLAEAHKWIAWDLRKMITEKVPQLAQLGEREGGLIEVQDAMESALARIEKSEIIPRGWLLRIAMRGLAGYGAASAIGMSADFGAELGTAEAVAEITLKNPTVKMAIARVLDKASKAGVHTPSWDEITNPRSIKEMFENPPEQSTDLAVRGRGRGYMPRRPRQLTGETGVVPTSQDRWSKPKGYLPPSAPNDATFTEILDDELKKRGLGGPQQ